MRVVYRGDEEFPGEYELQRANMRRSGQGARGQRALREIEAALIDLPAKRLIHGTLIDDNGDVCAIAAYGRHKGVDLSTFDAEEDSVDVGIIGGMPRLVAWQIVELNDRGRRETPEERYVRVLAWVREQLR